MIGSDEQRRVRGQRVEERADQTVGGCELGRIERRVEAVRVRDFVDTRVVGVDERRAPLGLRAHVLDEDGGGLPPEEVGAAQVRAREPAPRNSDFVTTGTARPPNTSWRWKTSGSGGRLPSACCQRMAFRTVPSSRIRNPVIPWRDGGRPVAIDVSATGVVDGTTVVIGPPVSAAISGRHSGWGPDCFPAEAVEHEEHDGARTRDRFGQPLDRAAAEQRRHHCTHSDRSSRARRGPPAEVRSRNGYASLPDATMV